jgi:hypothetical protein
MRALNVCRSIPIEILVREKKHIDTDGVWWKAVLAATGQTGKLPITDCPIYEHIDFRFRRHIDAI